MAYAALKIAGISGATVATGGGIMASTAMFSESSSSRQKTTFSSANEKIKSVIEEKGEEQKSKDVPPKDEKTCTLYKMGDPTGAGQDRKFTRLLEKLGSKEDFFAARDKESPKVENLGVLKSDINGGCDKSERVYIWYGSREGKWLFSIDLNKKDWIKESIEVPEELKIQK